MKLHLPTGLRSALFACFAAVASLGSTLATVSVTGGIFAVTLTGSQAVAAVTMENGQTYTAAAGEEYAAPGVDKSATLQATEATSISKITGSGTVVKTGAGALTITGRDDDAEIMLDIQEGELIYTGGAGGWGTTFTKDMIKVGAGASLYLNCGDALGWSNPNLIVQLKGEEGNVATLRASARTTLSAALNLQGNTLVKDSDEGNDLKGYDLFGTTISASGTNNVIEANLYERSASTINVLANGTLELKGGIIQRNNAGGAVTKKGSGELIISGTTDLNNATLFEEGKVTFRADSTLTSLTVASAATLAVDAGTTLTFENTLTLGSAIVNNGTIAFADSAKLDLSQLAATGTTYNLFTEGSTGSITGLTEDMLEGVQTAGRTWTIDLASGTISYVQTADDLRYGGDTLAWNEGVEMEGGTFNSGDMVTFTGATTATLGAPITSAVVTVQEGASLGLSNGGNAANVLTADSMQIAGTLTILDDVLAADVKVEGEGAVVFDWNITDDTTSYNERLSGFTGTVTVEQGRYNHTVAGSEASFKSLSIAGGASMRLASADYQGAVMLGSADAADATVLLTGSSLRGTIELTGNATVKSEADSAINSTITGAGDLTVADGNTTLHFGNTGSIGHTGDMIVKAGTVNLNGGLNFSGSLIVEGGQANIGNGTGATNAIAFGKIELKGGVVAFHHAAGNYSGTDVSLGGGIFYAYDTSSQTDLIHFGAMEVVSDTTWQFCYKGNYAFTELSGSAKLSVVTETQPYSEAHSLNFAVVRDFTGTVEVTKNDGGQYIPTISIGEVSQSANLTATIVAAEGTPVTSSGFSKAGAGDLVIVGSLAIDGSLTMNYEGGLYSDAAKTTGLSISSVADGTVLNYTDAANLLTLTAEAVGESHLSLNLLDVTDKLAEGINLGIDGTVDESQLSVGGLKDSKLEVKDGKWWVTGGSLDTVWDVNWGNEVIAAQPVLSETNKLTTLSANVSMGAEGSACDNGLDTVIVINLGEGGSSDYGVAGGIYASNSGDNGGAVTRNSWIAVESGTLGNIVGGSFANNWNGGSAAHFTGDSHIYVTGGTVENVVGGNIADGKGAQFTGDTYISIASDSVKGSVIGGSTSHHNSTITHGGDSRIWIYAPQTGSEGASIGATQPNAIIGGSAQLANWNPTVTHQGLSEINIDLTNYSGEASSFDKLIVGSSYLYHVGGSGGTLTQTGDASITIDSPDSITFTQNVIGASRHQSNGGHTKLQGNSNITISGGKFTGHVIGGSFLAAARTTIEGTSNITISGGVFDNLVLGGSFDNTGGTNLSQGGANLTISGGTFNNIVSGANYDYGTGGTANSWAMGDITITVSGDAQFNHNLFGGSYAQRNAASVTYTQGNITLNLEGGSFAYSIFAAGRQGGTSKLQTASTTVNLSSAATLGTADSGITVSGGYGGSGTGSTVTGDRTLNFTSTDDYANISNTTFKDFDVVGVVAGGDVTANITLDATKGLTKKGEGKFTLGAALTEGSLRVAEGTLGFTGDANTLTSLELAGGTVDASTTDLTLDGALTLGGGTLTLEDKSIALGTNGSLVVTDGVTLDLGTLGDEYSATILTGITDATTQLSQLDFTTDADTGMVTADIEGNWLSVEGLTDLTGAYLKLENGNLILTNMAPNQWYWDGTGGEWLGSSDGGWKPETGAPDGQDVIFDDRGLANSTVSISAEVMPTSVTVDVSAGNGYTFVADDMTPGSISGTASLTKKGEGSLSINLSNSYTGGTTLEAGTLNANAVNALGTGAVTVNGGTLNATVADAVSGDLVINGGEVVANVQNALGWKGVALNGGTLTQGATMRNTITFGGGTLHYSDDVSTFSQRLTLADSAQAKVTVADGKTATWDLSGEANVLANGLELGGTGTLLITTAADTTVNASGSALVVGDGATLGLNSTAGTATYNCDFSGAGDVILSGGSTILLNGDCSGLSGELVLGGVSFGRTGTEGDASSKTISAPVVRVADGTTNTLSGDATLSGTLSGTGALSVNNGNTLGLTGDVSQFTGQMNGAGTYALTVADGATMSLNATVGGSAAVTQDGPGTLELAAANSSTGELTVNAGTVKVSSGDWAGSILVGDAGTLHLDNAGSSITDVTSSGHVILEAGNDLDSLSGGNLTVNGDVTVASAANGLGTVTIAEGVTLTTSNKLKVAALDNGGTLDAGTSDLVITTATTKGGTVKAAKLTLTGDNTFTSITADAVEATGTLTLAADSSIGSLTGVTTLTTGAATTVTSGDVSLNKLSGTGSFSVAGKLTLGSASSLGGGLTVGGTLSVTDSLSVASLSGMTSLVINGVMPLPTGPVVTVDGALDSETLAVSVAEEAMLTNLGLGNGSVYNLVTAGSLSSALGSEDLSISLAAGTAGQSVTVGKAIYTIGLSEDGQSIILTATRDGNGWVAEVDPTTGKANWDGSDAAWADGVPTESKDASFLGEGSAIVNVVGTQSAGEIFVDTSDADAVVKAYTFEGGKVEAGGLSVVSGGLTLDNETEVKADEAHGWAGNTVIGSQASGAANDALLTVNEGREFTTQNMTLHVSSDATHGFVNNGATVVLGALTATDKTVINNNSLEIGAGSDIGKVEGAGTLVALGSAGVGTVEGAAAIGAAQNATLEVGTIVGGSIDAVAAEGGTVMITGTPTLAVGKLTGNAAGALLAADSDVTLGSASTDGLSVTAGNLDLTGTKGNVFGTLTLTGALTLDVSMADVSPLSGVATVGEGDTGTTPTALVTATTVTGNALTLTLTGVDELIASGAGDNGSLLGEYLLLTQTGSTTPLTVTLNDADKVKLAFAEAGNYDADIHSSVVAVGNNVVLRVQSDKERVWDTDSEIAGSLDLSQVSNQYDWLTYVDVVNVNEAEIIDLGDDTLDRTAHPQGLTVRNLTGDQTLTIKGTEEDLATLLNDRNSKLDSTLTIEGMEVQVDSCDDGHAAVLEVAETRLGEGAKLTVLETGNYTTGKLSGTAGEVSGIISVNGTDGSYSGGYNKATINMVAGGRQTLAPGTQGGLTITGDAGEAVLDYATTTGATLDAINTTGANVTLANGGENGAITTLTLAEASSMQGGTLAFNVNMDQIAANLGSANAPVIFAGETLTLTGTELSITQVDTASSYAFDLSNGTTGITLLTISEGAELDVSAVTAAGKAFTRYFENLRVENGALVGDLVTDYYGRKLGQTENGKAGLALLDHASLTANPQETAPGGDLDKVLTQLNQYADAGNAAAADELGAAVAGSGVAAIGSAALGDVERQLKAIRNRMTSMGVDQCVVNEDMPYVNAWVNAEGDYREMSADGTLAGYTLNSWGGTIGVDIDVNPSLTFGFAATAMYGDFTAESADMVQGDLDSYYLSAFARVTHNAWVHSFVATVGKHDLTLERTVNYGSGSYSTSGDTEGMSFGFLYEAGRTYALNEDASTCWQPVFNISYRHVGIDGYSESGSDAALRYGDQSLDMLTLGLGARLQTTFGENVYNRTSLFEARALAKFDAGDRESEADVAFAAIDHESKVKSAEKGAFGVELGAGLTVPVGQESGSLFVDGSVELRADYTNVNGTVGYRFNF